MPPTLTLGAQSWTLNKGTTTIGRQDTCDIVIQDRSLSRAHVTLDVSRDKIEVVDNNSSNGTFINGQRITSAELKDGQDLTIGTVVLKFSWPESVVNVSASPISREDAQQIKQKMASKADVKVDWKASLATAAAVGAVATGIIAGVIGAMLGRDAVAGAIMVGAVGGIATSLIVRNVTQQRVAGTLANLKDDLDRFYAGAKADLDLPAGFPELIDVIHGIRLGNEITKDRVANEWRLRLHEAQMQIQALEASNNAESNVDRGFTAPLLALDSQFRLQGWNVSARGLFKPGLDQIDNRHIMELLHNAQLGSQLVGLLGQIPLGTVQVYPGLLATQDGRPLFCIVSHAAQAPGTHEFLVQFVAHE